MEQSMQKEGLHECCICHARRSPLDSQHFTYHIPSIPGAVRQLAYCADSPECCAAALDKMLEKKVQTV